MTYRAFFLAVILSGFVWYAGNIVYDSFYRKNRKAGNDGTTEEEIDISQMVRETFKPIDVTENMQEVENATGDSGRGHVVKMSFKTVNEMESLINKAAEEPEDEEVRNVIMALSL